MPIFDALIFDSAIFDTGGAGTILDSPAVAVGSGSSAAPGASIRSGVAAALAGSTAISPPILSGGTGHLNVLAQGASTTGSDDLVTPSITVTAGRPVVVVFIDTGNDPTSGIPHTLSGAGQTWTEIYGSPVAGDDSAYSRMSIWTSLASSGGSGALTIGTQPMTAYAYAVLEFEPDGGGSATFGTELEATTAVAATSHTLALSGAPQYWLALAGASRATGYGDLTATPRAGWTELVEQIADEGTWLVGVHAQVSPLGGDTDASVSWNRSINIPLIAIPITVTGGGGGGTILESLAVAVGLSAGQAQAAAIGASAAISVGTGGATATGVLLRSASAVAIASAQAQAPSAAVRVSTASALSAGVVLATPALIRSQAAASVAGGIAAASLAMVRSSLATATGGASVAAVAAAIRSSVAVAVSGSWAEAQPSDLSYLISVAVAISSSQARATPAAILVAPTTSTGAGAAAAPPTLIRATAGTSTSLAVARAAASIILGGQGASIGASSLIAAAALIRSAPAVALSLARTAAPPAMIRSASGSASGLAIMAGLGVLVSGSGYANWRLAFATEKPRTGTILNKAKRKGEIMNPTRRGRLQELKE